MAHQDVPVDTCSFLLAHGDRSTTLSALKWSDESPSPDTKSWLTDNTDFSQRASSKSPSLYSVPSTCSTQDFPPTPPPNSSLRLPQVPGIPTIRHRTSQACDRCRERKTKCSGHRPTCFRCNSRGLGCKYSARETRIRGALKSRTLVQTFDNRPLFIETTQMKANPYGSPTPAYHSRMGPCQTSAFTRFSVGNDAPKAPTMPVYTTVPVAGGHPEECYWNPSEGLVPPSIAFPFRCGTWSPSSLDSSSNSVDKTRKPLHTGLPLLDTGRVKCHSYDQIPPTNSVEFNLDYERSTDGEYFPLSKNARQEPISNLCGWRADRAFQPAMPEDQGALHFSDDPFSLVDMENFSATGFPSFRTPSHVLDTHYLNGLGIFC